MTISLPAFPSLTCFSPEFACSAGLAFQAAFLLFSDAVFIPAPYFSVFKISFCGTVVIVSLHYQEMSALQVGSVLPPEIYVYSSFHLHSRGCCFSSSAFYLYC